MHKAFEYSINKTYVFGDLDKSCLIASWNKFIRADCSGRDSVFMLPVLERLLPGPKFHRSVQRGLILIHVLARTQLLFPGIRKSHKKTINHFKVR